MKIPKAQSSDFQIAPAGNHIAVLYGILDLGTQESTYQGKTENKHMLAFLWELPDERTDADEPCQVQRRINFTGNEAGNLMKIVNAIEQRVMKPEELEGYDLFSLIGRGCMLNCIHREHDGKTYCNIDGFSPLPKGLGVPDMHNNAIKISLDPEEWNQDAFDSLTDYWKNVISQSPEFLELGDATPF